MNISYQWLKRYIELSDDAATVAKILTSIGLEVGTVEEKERIKGGLEGLVVGEVVTSVPHPNSDHLHITTTRIAPDTDPIQIVCGAPNVAAGQKVIVATLGTKLYQGDECITIKKGKIRGEESYGMICAEDEIGVGTSHDGIMVLPADTPVGMAAKDYFHVESDTIIEVDITPNRSDAASHYGVARDLYAYYRAHGQEVALRRPDVSAFKVGSHSLPIRVEVENGVACPRYTGVSICGVTVGESPDWLKEALQSIGLRPINNIVDVTNFVLHENGQALHAFDADKIAGRTIRVRNAKEGEKFTTLDNVERTLSEKDLVISNAEAAMCLAGVFGGKDSGVSDTTKNVFLESAYFEPVGIRKTARRHQLSTDASFRYERGCDPNNTLYILKRCALLIQEVAGGEVSMDVCDICQTDFQPWAVDLSETRMNSLIGKVIGQDTLECILAALEIRWEKEGDIYHLQVPRYRVDVQRECDVVEDILRIYGYNEIAFPDKLNTGLSYSLHPNPIALQTRICEQLTAQGFREIMNNSLTKASYYEGGWKENCVTIKNPLSQDLSVMRQTLLFGGLESIQRNVNRKNNDIRFYEYGNCYHFTHDTAAKEPIEQYHEESHLGLWITGNKTGQSWVQKEERCTFYTLRAYTDSILRRMGIAIDRLVTEPAIDPEKECCCGIGNLFTDGLVLKTPTGTVLGYLAIVKKEVCQSFDIDTPVYYADLYWDALLKQNKQYHPVIEDLPRFPEVKRDLALLVDKQVRFADLAKAARETERKLLKQVTLFDVYEGKNLEEGKKSYALSFVLQDKEDTLKEKQIENIMGRIQKTLEEKWGAQLRS